MEKEQRNRLQKATQDARKLLEEEFRSQLLQTYDIDVEKVRWAEEPGTHLQAEQRLIRAKLVAWFEHKEAQINDRKEALLLALREMAFTALNRFVALKLMEARDLVRPCVSGGLESAGFLEFTAVAQGLLADQESSYRLYLETIFEDVSRELRALFDPRDPASLLWPKRAALLELLDILNHPEMAELWIEDETLGWVYQYFNGDAERKKMREESAAPRNSRELAVRNQFFTPRYVVEFLTDNTLGRIWYEMCQGNTDLKDRCRYLLRRPNEIWLEPAEKVAAQMDIDEALSQYDLLCQPAHITHRPLKDPREIRMLDPACGSMHFGLYAFDLYLEIYSEAWEIVQALDDQAKRVEAFAPFATYAADFASKADFLREVPRLILQCNIHGIDIDPRATQIARLTLWLRAQRAWKEQQVETISRPWINRSNVVCAEAMPGERRLLEDFINRQFQEDERGLFRQLLESVFDHMRLAGEAGSLLMIEEKILGAINAAKKDWDNLVFQQHELFGQAELTAFGAFQSPQDPRLSELTKDSWRDIEGRVYTALQNYAKEAEVTQGFQSRLFADDAARGFAFIDVCRKRYDIVVMNPPFGSFSKQWSNQVSSDYQHSSNDILATFVDSFLCRLLPCGLLGAITSRTCFFLSSFRSWRENIILAKGTPEVIADLGHGVMDSAMVEAAAYVISHSAPSGPLVCFRLLDASDKSLGLLTHIMDMRTGMARQGAFVLSAREFLRIPTTPFAYWVSGKVRQAFVKHPSLSQGDRAACAGLSTSDNFRMARLWWEIEPSLFCDNFSKETEKQSKSWFSLAKGGASVDFYSDIHLVLNWRRNGSELKAWVVSNASDPGTSSWSRRIANADRYFIPGITWSLRTQKGLSFRALPAGCIFSHKGPVVFAPENQRLALLALLNSSVFKSLVELQMAFGSYEVGVIQRTIVPSMPNETAEKLSDLARRGWLLKRWLDSGNLQSHAALMPAIMQVNGTSLQERIAAWTCRSADAEAELVNIRNEINSIALGLYDLKVSDMPLWQEQQQPLPGIAHASDDEESGGSGHIDGTVLIKSFLQYIVGVAYGRWDLRYATRELNPLIVCDPFAASPCCPPGQLQSIQGLPATSETLVDAYPLDIPWHGIFVIDPNHPFDIISRIRQVIQIVWQRLGLEYALDNVEQEARDILRLKTLRDYFQDPAGFFGDHLKFSSKSRRQAPLYWQLSAGDGRYSIWFYYHRFTKDTLFRVLRDLIGPRIQQAELEAFEIESNATLSGDAVTRLNEIRSLLRDLNLLKNELDHIAPLWNPNLSDGVIINHAILWRITPYAPWQKKCRECWDKLVKGDYDWAHLAFHLWPERVISKCTTDRSLAIAHGLEERLWQETNNGNWLPRQLSETDLQALIAGHSNPAVKSALERFLAAPPPVTPTRTRASRSTRSSGSSTPRRARGSAAVVDAEATRQVLLALTAAPSDGLAKTQIADLIGVEANALTAVIKQLKESGQINQLGERRGARYLLSEQGRAAVASQAGDDD